MPVRRTTGRGRRARGRGGPRESPGATRWFPPEPSSVVEARRFVAALVEDAPQRELAALLVSELATNALRHARSGFEVRVRSGQRLRVEVRDDCPSAPRLRPAPPEVPGGRGLFLVHGLSLASGWEPLGHGKLVWFEL